MAQDSYPPRHTGVPASAVSFDDSGLVVVSGSTTVQAALAALDARSADSPAAGDFGGTDDGLLALDGAGDFELVGRDTYKVVQVVTATSTVDDTTTSTSFVATSLQGSITPLHDDSLLIVRTTGRALAYHAGGATGVDRRDAGWRIKNVTDGVNLDGATNVLLGRTLTGASTTAARSTYAPALEGEYQVDSTAERTFRLDFSSGSSVLEALLQSSVSPALMTIMEVRP